MASIGPINLGINIAGDNATVDVSYELRFERADVGRRYSELCRIIGDDTGVGDPAEAAGDDLLAYIVPLFYREATVDSPGTAARHFSRILRTTDLDEDYGPIPNGDELRAPVTLTPVPTEEPAVVSRESNLVTKDI
ncbi:hypothetical protein BH18ACT4_BH18ACT4_02930 [soil metagenome]